MLCDADIALTVVLRRVANAECFGLSKVPTGAWFCPAGLLHAVTTQRLWTLAVSPGGMRADWNMGWAHRPACHTAGSLAS